ncbi:hypothetical protein C1280_15280 [Gemmata obscuriglobus]|uniref:Uncharacterized protein n=1 Tax=Gemmata obscuriglobus TaxID=114 RepID=A0A2Z3H911_9BACT|nr:hypothetical protein C1280_15280 [Gemmata obscuriglobus]
MVAALHFLMAAGGICVGTGFASVAGDLGVTFRALAFLVIVVVGTFIWAGVGLGIQMRWAGAWYASLVICSLTLIYGLALGVRSPCGAIYFGVPAGCVLAVLLARRDEFR